MSNNVTVKITGNNADANKKLQETANQISKMSNQSKAGQKALNDLNKSASGAAQSIQNIGSAILSGNFTGFIGSIQSMSGSITGLTGVLGGGTAAATGFSAALKSIALNPIGAAITGIVALGSACVKGATDFATFEQSTAELQSLTGVSDTVLDGLQDKIIDLSKEFATNAPGISDAMKLIGSQAPELLKDSDALLEVTKSANVLAKAGGMSVQAAANGITTVMNQMGVGADEVNNIINTLAKAQQAGAMSVEQLSNMMAASGTAAKNAGLDYTALTAAAEIIGPKFKSADEAGTSLKTMFTKLTMASDKFNPAVVGMEKALENLANANLSVAEKQKLVGDGGQIALEALISQREEYSKMKDAITGTNSAYEQMAINNDTLIGHFNKFKSAISANFLSLGKQLNNGDMLTGGFKGLFNIMTQVIDILFDIVSGVVSVVQSFFQMETVQTIIQTVYNAIQAVINVFSILKDSVMNVINTIFSAFESVDGEVSVFAKAISMAITGVITCFVGIIEVIAKVISAVVSFVAKAIEVFAALRKKIDEYLRVPFENFCNSAKSFWNNMINFLSKKWNDFVNVIRNTPLYKFISVIGNAVMSAFSKAINAVKNMWNEFLNWLGLSTKPIKEAQKKAAPAQTKQTVKTQNKQTVQNISVSPSTSKSSGGKVKTKVEAKIEPDKGSIKDLENKLSKLNDELNTKNVSDERLKVINKEKEELEKQIKDIKIRNGLLKEEVKPKETVKVDREKDLTIKAPKVDTDVIKKGSTEDKMKSLENARSQGSNIQKMVYEGIISPEEGKKMIDELNKQLESLNLRPLDLTLNTAEAEEKLKETQKKMDDIKDSTGAIGSIFGSLGSAIGGTTGELMNFAATAVQGIGQIIPQIMTLITAKNAEAIAAGTASGAASPFPANLVAIATIVSTIAGIFASLPSFASGGIISGSTTLGDYNVARVNSGEMILNAGQQGRLFNMLNSGTGNSVSRSSDVNFKISGTNLKAVQRNYDKKMSKIR